MNERPLNKIMRFIVLILLLQMLVISSVYAQTQGITETKLANGLTVIMKEVHAAPVFTAQVWFKVGSRNEHTGITGISHLLEHMLFGASKNYKKGEITGMVRERGGIDNAATWTDFTYYWELLSTDHLEFALKSLAEKAGNALLLDAELQKERTVVISELQGHENNPDRLLYQAVMAEAFEAHPYQWPVIGWESDVKKIDRNQLVSYYNSYYHPNNATLVLVGDFNSAKALNLVKKYFGLLSSHALPRPVYTVEPVQRGTRTVVIRREGSAERVLMGYHVPSLTDPDSYVLTVLDQILSGGKASRLYQALVEKQLATSAWSSSGSRKDPSLFFVGATARRGVDADTLQKALAEQLEIIKNAPPTEQEMQAAKNQLEAYLIFQNDSVSDQGEQLGYYNTVNSWRYLETLIPKIKTVTPEQVQETAKKYFTENNLTIGKFIPNAPGPNGNGGAAIGPVHNKRLQDIWADAAYYTKPKTAAPVKTTKAKNNLAKPARVALDNGMVVIVQENHSNPTVAITGNLKGGSYFDSAGKDGVASLVADTIGRGTQKRSALELSREVEFVGASLDTSASVESASFSAKSLSKDMSLMLDLLSDELRNATFPVDQFERAKGEMISNLEQSKESTENQAFRTFRNSVYPAGHPYHEPLIDEAIKQVDSISRDDLVSFYKSYYRPDTAIIVIVGDVYSNEAIEQVKKYFGEWKAEGPVPKVEIPTVEPQKEAKKIVVPITDKSEVDVVFGHAFGVSRADPNFYTVRIMNQILGGGGALSSILGEEIREKLGLVYNVYSTFDATLGAGPWYASLGTNPKNADKAVDTLKREVKKFQDKGASKKDFNEAREFIIGVFPIALETNSGVARTLLSAEFYGLGMDYLQNYAKYYRSVTLEQVNASAKKYLHPDAATLVIAGPYEK